MTILSDIFEGLGTLGVSVRTLLTRADRLEKVTAGTDLTTRRLSKDSNGIFTITEWWTNDSIPFVIKRSTLSNVVNFQYTQRTQRIFRADTSVVETRVFTLSYDADGDLISEVLISLA